MDGLELRLRGGRWTVRYFPAGETITSPEPIRSLVPREDALLAPHPGLRRIVLRYPPHWTPTVQYLHWSNGDDLATLDELVRAGLSTDEDFAGALAAEAIDLRCRACGTPSRVLMASPGDPLFGDPRERLRAHRFIKHCPSCGERWTASVLEIIRSPSGA
jgi:hypothetical protein